jgi:hypothetical protein
MSVPATADESHDPGRGREQAHLQHPEPVPAVGLRDEQAGPPELDDLGPHLVGDAPLVVEHRSHAGGADLPFEERTGGRPEGLLLLAEREVHGPGR